MLILCHLTPAQILAAGLRGDNMTYPNKLGFYRDGLYRRKVKSISTATTGYTVYPEDSGTLFYIPAWTTGRIHLPKISSNWLGLEYTFFDSGQASSLDLSIKADTLDSSAVIQMNYSSVVDNSSACSPGSTFPAGLRLTAMSSVVWMGQTITANSYSMSSDPADNLSGWVVGVAS